jgi:tRNA-modifying protein YgfZ
MQTDWPPLLAQLGASLCARGDVDFGQGPQAFSALAATLTIAPLAPYGILEMHGPDSAKFLQGQLTCDVQEVGPTRSTPGAYCTQKGRMLSSFQLLRREDDRLWLRMRADLIENTAGTLGKYAVFSKAKLARRIDIVGFGVHGPGAADFLQQSFGGAPAGQNATLVTGDALLLQRDSAGDWFECWLPATAAADLWQQSTAYASPAGTEFWRWLVLRSGFGEISAATAELFIPQMLNYHVNGAVNFKKGCYTGQEIVARTHYRGQVKRHAQLAACSSALAPQPGAEVLGAAGNIIGNVVDSARVDGDRYELLVVVADSEGTAGSVRLGDEVTALTPLPLPYAIN